MRRWRSCFLGNLDRIAQAYILVEQGSNGPILRSKIWSHPAAESELRGKAHRHRSSIHNSRRPEAAGRHYTRDIAKRIGMNPMASLRQMFVRIPDT
jgi:hypothetical protein